MGRGVFVCVEGIDHSGKSAVVGELARRLEAAGHRVECVRFPARETATGRVLEAYLRGAEDVGAEAVHLMYTANRWEAQGRLRAALEAGAVVLCDRYSYSGVAYSMSKGLDRDWCWGPEKGLLRPDLVVYLQCAPEEALRRAALSGKPQEIFDSLPKLRCVDDCYQQLHDNDWLVCPTTATTTTASIADSLLPSIPSSTSKPIQLFT